MLRVEVARRGPPARRPSRMATTASIDAPRQQRPRRVAIDKNRDRETKRNMQRKKTGEEHKYLGRTISRKQVDNKQDKSKREVERKAERGRNERETSNLYDLKTNSKTEYAASVLRI